MNPPGRRTGNDHDATREAAPVSPPSRPDGPFRRAQHGGTPAGRFAFALAGPADDAELRRRMAEVWMEGSIAVSFRREPSYFAGCRLQGEQVQVVKCVDRHDGSIAGMGSRLVTTLHVNGVPTRVGYLADLRLRPALRHGTLLARGYRCLRALHRADPLPFYLTVIFDDNAAAMQSLLGGRAGLPHYSPLGRILTPALHLDFARPAITVDGVAFGRADAAAWPELRALLRREAANKQFSPAYAEADFGAGGKFAILVASDFLVARSGGRIVACVAAWDQSAVRQVHIERYAWPLRLLRPLHNAASRVGPMKPLPAPGERLPCVYLSCIAVQGNDLQLFRGLLRFACNTLRNGRWHYAIAGLHEDDPLSAALMDQRRIDAAGQLFIVHYPEDGDPRPGIDARTRSFEMALA